jgi:integration host factor subunit beta
MTRSQLIEKVAEKLGIDRAAAESAVRVVFDSMEEALLRGEGVELRGFGSFSVRSYGAYRGRNPRNGAPVDVDPKRSPVFKIGKPFRARIEASGRKGGAGANPIAAVSDPLAGGGDAE